MERFTTTQKQWLNLAVHFTVKYIAFVLLRRAMYRLYLGKK